MLKALRSVALIALAAAAPLLASASAHAAVISRAEAAAAVAAAGSAPQGRIFNGTIADIRQSPWQVLVYSDDGEYLTTCGGSIISPTQVVTAAHCVSDIQANNLIGADPDGSGGLGVIAGVSNYHGTAPLYPYFRSTPALASTDTEEDRTVNAASVHPDWAADEAGLDLFPSGDVAVITVSTAFIYTAAVQPIALPPAVAPINGDPIPVPATLRTVGFGQQVQYDQSGNDVPPNGYLYAQGVSVVDPDVCSFAIDARQIGVDSAVSICGQTPIGTTCHGDSGSGLVTLDNPPVLVGVVSSGPDPCASGEPTFFTSLIAPENQQFVAPPRNLAPPRAPRQRSLVVLAAPTSMAVGGTVSCYGGSFTSATLIKWSLTSDTGAVLASGTGTSLSYILQSTDVGHLLSCRAVASSTGGVAVSNLASSAARVTIPAPASQATPVPTPNPTNQNALAPVVPATFAIAATSKARRGKLVTIKVAMSTLPAGSDTTIVSVPRLATSKHSQGSPMSVTNYPKTGETTSSFTLRLRVPRHAQTGTRSFPVKTFVYKLGALVGATTQTVRVKITK